MLKQSEGRGRRFQALLLLALAGCSTAPAPPLEPPQALRVPAPGTLPVPPAAARLSQARTLAEYQREFANLLHAANPDRVYEGAPPNPLRAVIVYYAEIDSHGDPGMVLLFRAPDHAAELQTYAEQTLRRAAPFPRPRASVMNGVGRVAFTESWLFGYDGRFRLRTLSLPQAAPDDDEL